MAVPLREEFSLYFLASLVGHVTLFATSAFWMPVARDEPVDEATSETQYYLLHFALAEAGAVSEAPEPREPLSFAIGLADSAARWYADTAGSLGEPELTSQNTRFGVEGPRDNPQPRVGRDAREATATFWSPGLTYDGGEGDPAAPIAPWGRAYPWGRDAWSARGRFWGKTIAPARGSGGGGTSGIGEYSNGEGDGRGLPMHPTPPRRLF
jgi:hypothetical protein